MVLAANTLMGNRFQGFKSYTDGVHRNEKKSEKTEKDSGFSPKTKKVKILDKTKNVNLEENTEKDNIDGDGDGDGVGEVENSSKEKIKGNDRSNNRNKNKNKNDESKITNLANSSSGPSSLSIPIDDINENVVLNRATASDRIKQIKLLVLMKIIKKFEVKKIYIFFSSIFFSMNIIDFFIYYYDTFYIPSSYPR